MTSKEFNKTIQLLDELKSIPTWTNEKKNKLKAYELLNYIYSSERHAKYLDNVKHPAKAKKNSKEILELYENADIN